MKRIVNVLIVFLMAHTLLFAQDGNQNNSNSNFHMALAVQSKYMWRGIEYGTSPVLFPTLNYQYN